MMTDVENVARELAQMPATRALVVAVLAVTAGLSGTGVRLMAGAANGARDGSGRRRIRLVFLQSQGVSRQMH